MRPQAIVLLVALVGAAACGPEGEYTLDAASADAAVRTEPDVADEIDVQPLSPFPDVAAAELPVDAGAPDLAPRDAALETVRDAGPDLGPAPLWYGPQLVVGVGFDGRRVVSADGTTWGPDLRDGTTNRDGPKSLRALAYGDNVLVVVGGSCEPSCASRVMTFDGNSWTEIPVAPGLGQLTGVAFGKGTFVVVGTFGPVLRGHYQARMWVETGRVIAGPLAVAFGAVGGTEMFVAVGDDGLSMRSLDGLTWTNVQRRSAGQPLRALAIGNGVIVAVGGAGSGRRVRSADGITWTDEVAGGPELTSVVWDGTRFLAYAVAGDTVHISADGKAWMSQSVPGAAANVAYGRLGGAPFFVGRSGSPNSVKTSANGTMWTVRLQGRSGDPTLNAFGFAGPPGGGPPPPDAGPDVAGDADVDGAAAPGDAGTGVDAPADDGAASPADAGPPD